MTCTHCRSSGYRRVVLPRTVRDYIDGRRGYIYTGAVPCICRVGSKRHYVPSLHCLVEGVKQKDLQAVLLAWIEEHGTRCVEGDADNWQPAHGQSHQQVIGMDSREWR